MLILSDQFNQRIEDFFKAVKKQARQNLSKGTKLQYKKRPINKTKNLYSNIRFRDAKGQFAKGNYKSIGYVLAKSIYEKGIRANNFLTIPFVNEFKKLPQDLQDIFADDLLILMIDSMIEAQIIKRGN